MGFGWSRWLVPETGCCLACGKRCTGRPSASCPVRHPEAGRVLGRLCPTCQASIPWIRKPVCRICGRPEACPDCPRRKERAVVFTRGAVRYEAAMKSLLALYKYRGSEKLEELMAAMLAFGYERILAELPDGRGRPLFEAVTSVPLAAERLEERGFNQAERMARLLADWYGLAYRPLLRRNRHTEKQSLKTRRSRLADMKGNFSATPVLAEELARASSLRRPCRILLVDDVYTTGSTLQECASSIRAAAAGQSRHFAENPVYIYGLAWARS